MFIRRTDAEAEVPILWPPDVKNRLIGKAPDAGKDWRWEKGTTEDEMDGWMASQMWWTWVWTHSGSWWWTGRPGVLQSLGSQSVEHNWMTELIWTKCWVEEAKQKRISRKLLYLYIVQKWAKLECIVRDENYIKSMENDKLWERERAVMRRGHRELVRLQHPVSWLSSGYTGVCF